MIDNHHLVYIGAIIVALVGMLVLAAGLAVAGAARIRKRRKPVAAAQTDEDEPDDVLASQSSRSHAGGPGGVDDPAIGRGSALYMLPAMMSQSLKGERPVRVTIPG